MPSSAPGYAAGDRVRVIDGPFAGFEGVVQKVKSGRSGLKLAVSVKSRPVDCAMYFHQVEKAG
jgi:transcriptional antiterminator NusG